MSKSTATEEKKTIPEILSYGDDLDWVQRAVELLETGNQLRAQIGAKDDEKTGKEGVGLLGRLSSIEAELRLIITEHNLEGVRFGDVAFVVSAQPGRTTVDHMEFKKELLMLGVSLEVLKQAEAAATKVGNSFWKREWKVKKQ